MIPCALYYFFMAFIDTVDIPMYLDAAEYWLDKTGVDTRAYILSMFSVAVKAAIAISTAVIGVILNLIRYTPGMALDAKGASALCWATALGPPVGYLLPIVLLLFHGVSDKRMEEIIKSNAVNFGAAGDEV